MRFQILTMFTSNFSILIRDNDLDLSIPLDPSSLNNQRLFRIPFHWLRFRRWNWHWTVLHRRHVVFYVNIFENVAQRIGFAVQLVVGILPVCRLDFRRSSCTSNSNTKIHFSFFVPISRSIWSCNKHHEQWRLVRD